MKVVFLDVDGVLNSDQFDRWCNTNKLPYWWHYGLLDQNCLMNFSRLIQETGALVVVCSSWRLYPRMLEVLRQQLELYGVSIFSYTTENSKLGRGTQILEWIGGHPVDPYIILDDDDSEYDYPMDSEVRKHLIKVEGSVGLQQAHVNRGIRMLGGKVLP